jgi:glycosyltransferase involved in cell wall biosynthesis
MKPTNILHIRDSSGIYGSERVILTLGSHINKAQFNFSLLCLRRQNGKSDPIISLAKKKSIDVSTVDVEGKLDIKAIFKIRKLIKEKNISIIHSHDFKSNFYGLAASVNLGIVRIVSAHGSTRDSLMKQLYLFMDEWIVYRFFDRIIAVSYRLYLDLIKKHNKDKVIVIQNGLDINLLEYHGDSKETPLPINIDKAVFAVIGRLYPDKGHAYFLEALSIVYKINSNIIGFIIGDGPEKSHIENMILEMGLNNIVHLCGVRHDMSYVYRNVDCLVIPSLTEGLPYVLLEAMAMGLPVLATSVGDIPLLIRNGETGYLVPSGNAQDLANCMNDFLDNRQKAKDLGSKGQTLVNEYYSADKMVRQTQELYQTLLS